MRINTRTLVVGPGWLVYEWLYGFKKGRERYKLLMNVWRPNR